MRRAVWSQARGFSLFTPLVGTAVAIMTILITVSMLENDARISQTLTAGFEAASQEAAGRLIRAAAAAQIAYNLETTAYTVLNGSAGYSLMIKCSSKTDCFSKAKTRIETSITDSLLVTTVFYKGLSAAVSAASEYGLAPGQDVDQNILNALQAMKSANKKPFAYAWTDYLTTSIVPGVFAGYSQNFEAEFEKGGTRIRVSILPDEAGAQTQDKVGAFLEACAEDALQAGFPPGLPLCPFSYSCTTNYKLKNGEGLAVAYCK